MLHQKLEKDAAKTLAIKLFKEVQLPTPERIFETYPHQISGGQKQRVMIAMAMSCQPSVLIADEPARAEFINFTDAYVEIEATYIVPMESRFQTVEDVDRTGVGVAVSGTSAYDLYLTRTLKNAKLHRAEGLPAAADLFANENLDALAGLRPALNENLIDLPYCRILNGRYMAVQQAVGTKHGNQATIEFLQEFILQAKESGLILDLLKRHDVNGKLQVAI